MPSMKSYEVDVTLTVPVRAGNSDEARETALGQATEALLGRSSPSIREKYDRILTNINVSKVD